MYWLGLLKGHRKSFRKSSSLPHQLVCGKPSARIVKTTTGSAISWMSAVSLVKPIRKNPVIFILRIETFVMLPVIMCEILPIFILPLNKPESYGSEIAKAGLFAEYG